MASSFDKSVKGATKIKLAPPKTKYIEHILIATHSGEAGVGEVFRALQLRLRDSTWTVVFKSLITVHLMIREGSPDVTLAFLARHRNILAVSVFSDAQTQGRNIRHYSGYLTERARAYRDTKCDWVRAKETRLEKLTVERGLLRETEVVQHQLTALLKCDVMENEPENEITITTFRLLVLDLLALFQVLNQAMITILGHFFEMSKPDADRAMDIYRNFTKQTDYVVQYLSVARQYEHHTRVEVPKLKHAPVNLGRQLEDYLKDPDFEVHRRQYLAELDAKKSKGASAGGSSSKLFKTDGDGRPGASKAGGPRPASESAQPAKGPDPDLIDFFDSIEQNQTTMSVQSNNPQPQHQMGASSPWGAAPFQAQPAGHFQPSGLVSQSTGFQGTNPFQPQATGAYMQPQQQQPQPQQQQQQQPHQVAQPMQPAYTGAGFGGYTPQPSFQPSALAPIPQNSVALFPASPPQQLSMPTGQQSMNPFRQSMLMANPTGLPTSPQGAQPQGAQPPATLQPQSTNPFARSSPQAAQPFGAPSSHPPFQTSPPHFAASPPAAAPLQATPTGTNPFAKNFAGPQQGQHQLQQQPQQQQERMVTATAAAAGALAPQPTGSTNPFRQSAFVNHQTGLGWQQHQGAIGGGLDQLETIPVFPRPAAQTPWQQ